MHSSTRGMGYETLTAATLTFLWSTQNWIAVLFGQRENCQLPLTFCQFDHFKLKPLCNFNFSRTRQPSVRHVMVDRKLGINPLMMGLFNAGPLWLVPSGRGKWILVQTTFSRNWQSTFRNHLMFTPHPIN